MVVKFNSVQQNVIDLIVDVLKTKTMKYVYNLEMCEVFLLFSVFGHILFIITD